jgi:hypothetical protein
VAALHAGWTPAEIERQFGLYDARLHVMGVGAPGGPTLWMRAGNGWVKKRIWRVSDRRLQLYLLDRWVAEMVDEVKAAA